MIQFLDRDPRQRMLLTIEPISMMALAGGASAATGLASSFIQSGAAKRAEAASLSMNDRAMALQQDYLSDITALYSPFVTVGRGALDILQSRVYSSTERKMNTVSQRTALEGKIASLSAPIEIGSIPILTGEKASERRHTLWTTANANRERDLRAAKAELDTFNRTQAELAPLFAEQDARSNASAGRVQSYLDRISEQSNLPTSLADLRSQLSDDPVFQFRQAEGERAINRAAAARGSFFSGAAIGSLADFSMKLTGEETDKILERKLLGLNASIQGLNAETAQNQVDISNIGSLANFGMQGAQGVSQASGAVAGNQAQLATQAGQTMAQSSLQQGQAWSNMLNQTSQSIGSLAGFAALPSLLGKPTTAIPGSGPTSGPTHSGMQTSLVPGQGVTSIY